MDDMLLPKAGERYLVMEALGYIIGTVEVATPFGTRFGTDAVWVRDLGQMRDAMRTGRVNECHPLPGVTVDTHARRWYAPWPHATPRPA